MTVILICFLLFDYIIMHRNQAQDEMMERHMQEMIRIHQLWQGLLYYNSYCDCFFLLLFNCTFEA